MRNTYAIRHAKWLARVPAPAAPAIQLVIYATNLSRLINKDSFGEPGYEYLIPQRAGGGGMGRGLNVFSISKQRSVLMC